MAARGTIIVTGASSGIGRAIAGHLSREGFDVVGTSRSAPDLERLDVTDEASCAALVRRVLARTGRIDGLVNNAGQAMLGAQEECTTDEVRALFDTNVFGAMRMTRAVLPTMRVAKRGRILHVSSVVGRIPAPFMGAYGATKHALEGYSTALDHELRGTGVRSVLVRAGFMRTAIAAGTVRVGASLDAYATARGRFEEALSRSLAGAADPVIVARCVAALLATPNPRLAYAAGREAASLARAATWLPEAAFSRSLRRQFGLS